MGLISNSAKRVSSLGNEGSGRIQVSRQEAPMMQPHLLKMSAKKWAII